MNDGHPLQISDFKIIRTLGEGGFGKVYLARRNLDNVKVCLKEITLRYGVSQQDVEREAKTLSELKHENIIGYYGSFVESGKFYIVMEYASEGSLADRIAVCYCLLFYIDLTFICLSVRNIETQARDSVSEKYLLSSIKLR